VFCRYYYYTIGFNVCILHQQQNSFFYLCPMLLLTPKHFSDYELIDCGDFEKLERFGEFVTSRPEPQAVWSKRLSEEEWKSQANAVFKQTASHQGEWHVKGKMPEQWNLKYQHGDLDINFKLALTQFKHIGIFPEQASNWDFIFESVKQLKSPMPKVLNLFAYTGGASLAAKAAGADVVHVDSMKQVVNWANENMLLSRLSDIRWTVEDAAKYVQREVRRLKKYQGIILDPPAYGIGAKGERWKLEDMVNDLLADCKKILDSEDHFFLINTYSLGFSSLIIENMLAYHFPDAQNTESGELFLQAGTGYKLPLGVFGRFRS
jgi:23S rRNA (cytosine1962-C5)-methyltransferase